MGLEGNSWAAAGVANAEIPKPATKTAADDASLLKVIIIKIPYVLLEIIRGVTVHQYAFKSDPPSARRAFLHRTYVNLRLKQAKIPPLALWPLNAESATGTVACVRSAGCRKTRQACSAQ